MPNLRATLAALLAAVATLACARGGPAGPSVSAPTTEVAAEVQWSGWDERTFTRASAERRIILVNVVATWCHWCHVMEETTYADPEVARILGEHFVTIRIDSDARPDVAERYRAWGWPATAVLTPDAEPVVNVRGYRDPKVFAAFLRELVADERAGTLGMRAMAELEPVSPPADLEHARTLAAAQLDGFWDDAAAGWGGPQKYPWPAPIEHALMRARVRGETLWRERALRTLTAQRRLIDPVWGGMYQYSVGGVWERPHYEKIAMIQAGAIETYALAARVTGDPTWLDPAREVARFVLDQMQHADGGFFTSQDADLRPEHGPTIVGAEYYARGDAERRALGIPRIDTNVYADLNGMTIVALVELARAGGDAEARHAAIRAGDRLLVTHLGSGGAFVHAEHDDRTGLLHLADQAAMGRALLALHDLTDDRKWLEAARRLGDFVLANLQDPDGGFFAHTSDPHATGVFARRRKPLEENGTCARFLLALHRRLDGDGTRVTPYATAARRAITAVGSAASLRSAGKVVGRHLLAAELLTARSVDITIVGEPEDPAVEALARAALAIYEPRATIERSRPGERYPHRGRAAVYLCTDTACSPPITDPRQLAARAEAFFAENLDRAATE